MVSFYLRPSHKRPGYADVYANIQFSCETRFRKSTGVKVKIAHWDEKQMKLKPQAAMALEVNLAKKINFIY